MHRGLRRRGNVRKGASRFCSRRWLVAAAVAAAAADSVCVDERELAPTDVLAAALLLVAFRHDHRVPETLKKV